MTTANTCPILAVAELRNPRTPRTATVGPDLPPPADIIDATDAAATHALRMTGPGGATVVCFASLGAVCKAHRELSQIETLTLEWFVLRR